MTMSQTKMTAKAFLQMGEDPPGYRLELTHGEIAVSPSPSRPHSHVDRMLTYFLIHHILQHDLGELLGDIDTIFGTEDVRRPDIVFVSKSRQKQLHGHGVSIAPDLCVEILSPSSIEIDRQDKFTLYARFNVPNYWLVDPIAKTFEAYTLRDGIYTLDITGKDTDTVSPAPFPALSLPLAQLWTTRSVE